MARYNNIDSKDRFDGKKVFSTRLMPRIPVSENDIYIYSQEGDTLDGLSDKYYRNPSYWWIIANANKIGKGTRFIKPGIQIRIPVNISQVLSDFEKE